MDHKEALEALANTAYYLGNSPQDQVWFFVDLAKDYMGQEEAIDFYVKWFNEE